MEEYRVIDGYENYEVSDLGNVRNKKNGRILKGGYDDGGYRFVSLNKKQLKVHRLVALAFIDNPENKPIVDHINNDRSDNRLVNLRWATNPENGANCKMNKNNTSGYKGLRYDQDFKKWCVKFNASSFGRRYFKMFNNLEDAIVDRVEILIERYGDFVNESELALYKKIIDKRNC
jgi:hypothetical protein